MRIDVRLLVAAVLMLGVAPLAAAHPAPFSFVDLYRDGTGVHGTLVVHDYDAAHELGVAQPDTLLDAATARARGAELLAILGQRLHLTLDGREFAPHWQDAQVLAERQSLYFAFTLDARTFGRLDIVARLFPYDASHETFVNVYEGGTLRHQAILDARQDALTYYAGNLQGRALVVRAFVLAGIQHILIGPDHVLFLTGLLLLGGGLWRLTGIVTAFTLGHTLTLSLAALGVVRLAPRLVEPAIALSIVVVGVDNLLVRQRQEQPGALGPPAARDLRPVLAAAFGLVHGFGFASVLQEIGLPRGALAWSLASFNFGVEIGQLLIVLAVSAALVWLRRRHHALAERCVALGSVAVILAGAFWFVQRLWFAPV